MPRVPILNGPSVMPGQPYSVTSPALRDADLTTARVVGEVGRSVAQVGGAIMGEMSRRSAEEEAAAKEAEAVIEAESMLAFDGQAQRSLGEFRKVRGLAASERSAGTFDAMEKSRQEVAASIKSPRAKARFLTRSAESLMQYRRQAEGHVGQEFERAREATAKGRESQLLAMSEAGIPDFGAWLSMKRGVEADIRELAPSKEAADAAVADLQSKAGSALVQGLVAQGRTDAAKKFVDEHRAELGSRYVEAKSAVDRATAGAEKERQAGEVVKLVDTTMGALHMEGAEYVTEEALKKALPAEGFEGEAREQLERELQQRVVAEDRRLRKDIQTARDDVNRADLDGGKAGAAEDFLKKYDPDFLLARQARRRAEFRQWKASKSNDAKERAAAAKAQRELDLQFRYRLEATLTNDPGADPAEVAQAFIAEKAKEGEDITISASEIERGGASAAKAQKRAGTEEHAREKAAASRFEKTFGAISKPGKGKPVDQKLLNERVGKAMSVYHQRTEAKGAPLDESELAAIEAELVTQQEVEVPGRFFGTSTKKMPAVDALPGESADLRLRPGPALKPEQQRAVEQALEWARSNPNDPRAASILRKLGQQPR